MENYLLSIINYKEVQFMNNFNITDKLLKIFNITEKSLNRRKVIFPIDIFIAMILEDTGSIKDLNNHFLNKLNKYKEIALNLPRNIEGNKNQFFITPISDSTLEILTESLQIMSKRKQTYLNEIYVLKALIKIPSEVTTILTKEELHYLQKFCNTSKDLLVDLRNIYSFNTKQNGNFVIRKALNKDKYLLYDFVKENFNSIWADSLVSIFPSNNIPIYLVLINDHIIGFSAYDILGTSTFGPIGVLKDFRKHSIGKALLNKCLWDMKLRGDSIVIIKNAGPIEFYEKCCNAHII